MTFFAPAMLVGLAAALLPLLIHLIGRRNAKPLRFAAFDFLLRSNRALARRLRVRQIVLLALRTLLVAALVMMMAKPACEVQTQAESLPLRARQVVLVVDDTLSMSRRYHGSDLLGQAKRRALKLLEELPADAEVGVLRVTDPSGPLSRLTHDRRRVRRSIQSIQLTQRHAELSGGISAAVALLRGQPRLGRAIIVLSDMARHGLSATRSRVPAGMELRAVDVAQGLGSENWAVTEVSAQPSQAPGRRPMRIAGRICNYGAKPARRELQLEVGGEAVARASVQLDGGACTDKRFDHDFERGGVHPVELRLKGAQDALSADDSRYLRVEVRGDLRLLLVNGRPSPVRHRDELFYLSTALRTSGAGPQRIAAAVVRVEDLDPAQLGGVDVVALCNVKALSAEQTAALKRFVAGGGGLLITMGDAVQPAFYNTQLRELLAQPLRGSVSVTAEGEAAGLHLGGWDGEHPALVSAGGDPDRAGLRRARFFRVYRFDPQSRGGRRVVLRFDDGSPALIERPYGAGRALVFASSVDRDWTDLPIRPGFLPLMQALVRYLGRGTLQERRQALLVGETYVLRIPPKSTQLRLSEPDGHERVWPGRALADKRRIEVVAERAGFYRVSMIAGSGTAAALPQQGFAANVEVAESQLAKGQLEEVRAPAGPDRATIPRRHVELWHALGGLLLLLLLGESWLVRRG